MEMAVVDSNSKADYGKADKMGIDTHRRDCTSKDVARFNICNSRQEMPRMAGSTRRRWGGYETLIKREYDTVVTIWVEDSTSSNQDRSFCCKEVPPLHCAVCFAMSSLLLKEGLHLHIQNFPQV